MAEESQGNASETSSEDASSAQQERPQLPPVDFSSFISELATTALAYLGGLQNPETKEALVDLEMAKRFIDTIDLLQEKTKGNLTVTERSFLDNTLYNLRMNYVRLAKNPPPKGSETSGPKDETGNSQ